MKDSIKRKVFTVIDICTAPFGFLYLPLLREIRRHGVQHFPRNLKRFLSAGVFPIRDHYYEPQVSYSENFDAKKKRKLLIDFRLEKQVEQLANFKHSEELLSFPRTGDFKAGKFYVDNPAFGPGDSDLYYLVIRNLKPKRIIEIGSGYSTLVCLEAIRKNAAEGNHTHLCCIEPYELSWLEKIGEIELIREKVENVSPAVFESLEENDILFIDSSHIIRPENDVLFEYLELLPKLKKGVIIHIHDIFSPRHYLKEWLQEAYRFWNEQYLLEAFLYYNDTFEIMFTANHLKNDAFEQTRKTLVNLSPADEPGSFWMRKIK